MSVLRWFALQLRDHITHRAPDVTLVRGDDGIYMRRWWVIPRNRRFNIYLHQFLNDDDDRALHDHPWWNLSYIFENGYIEHVPGDRVARNEGDLIFRRATDRHRVQLYRDGQLKPVPCWSLFITGRNVRSWGFWCDEGKRFVHWRTFTGVDHNRTGVGKAGIGIGCGEE